MAVVLAMAATAIPPAPSRDHEPSLSEDERQLVRATRTRIVDLAAFDKAIPMRMSLAGKYLLIGFTLKSDGTVMAERIHATNFDAVGYAEFLRICLQSVRLIKFSRVPDSVGDQPALLNLQFPARP